MAITGSTSQRRQNDPYIGAILENFDRETINYGPIIKKRENGRTVGKIRSVVFGEMGDTGIDTVYIERYYPDVD